MNRDSDPGDSKDREQDALETRRELLPTDELVLHPDGPVTLDDRDGVYAHSFKCAACQLEYMLMSWKRSRHRADNTYCPECGEVTDKMHWRACLSDSEEFVSDGTAIEIFNVIPVGQEAELVSFSKPD